VHLPKDKFYIHTAIPPESTASHYYRLEVPIMTLAQLGYVVPLIDDWRLDITARQRVNAFSNASINLLYQPIGKDLLSNIEQAKKWKQVRDRETGIWQVPPSFVIDTDDNLFDVNPLNGAFGNLGIRGPDGQELKPKEAVGIQDENGLRTELWRDGENFSLEQNRDRLEQYRALLRHADLVTCSTPEVEAYVKREAGEQIPTFVTPNCIRFDHYPDMSGLRLEKSDPDEVRVLWQGSPTHEEDWYPLRHALGHLGRKYKHVRWIVWGAMYRWAIEALPQDRLIHIRWVPYSEYKTRLCTIGHDINLAPLRGHRFNRCRSAIKWYEASAIWQPAATLAQNTGPYAAEIQDGETGLLFDDPIQFADKLAYLIEDATARKRLAANAKDWVNENRDAFKVSPKLWEQYQRIREERRSTCERMSEEEMDEMRREMEADEMNEQALLNGAAEGADVTVPAV
jgi:glycosyltransferase involved in cell wall biosynthesis